MGLDSFIISCFWSFPVLTYGQRNIKINLQINVFYSCSQKDSCIEKIQDEKDYFLLGDIASSVRLRIVWTLPQMSFLTEVLLRPVYS